MKLIFLDLDGVLVTRRPGVMEDRLLSNLQGLVARTGAEIVLSSDWRRHPAARDEARRVLATVGLKIIGCTPCMSAFLAQRPTEIMQWKKDFVKRPGNDIVANWVAIDDRPLLEERHGTYLRGHFVQTHPLRGLTEQSVEECVKILMQDPPPTAQCGIQADDDVVLVDPMSPPPGTRPGVRSSSIVGARGRPGGGPGNWAQGGATPERGRNINRMSQGSSPTAPRGPFSGIVSSPQRPIPQKRSSGLESPQVRPHLHGCALTPIFAAQGGTDTKAAHEVGGITGQPDSIQQRGRARSAGAGGVVPNPRWPRAAFPR